MIEARSYRFLERIDLGKVYMVCDGQAFVVRPKTSKAFAELESSVK